MTEPAPGTRPTGPRAASSRLDGTRADLEPTHADGSRRAGGGGRASSAFAPGARFAGTTIVAELGRGAMGRVFRARDELGRDVALKVLLRAPDDEDLERFAREGQAMAAVPPHAGVVAVHSAGVLGGVAYLVMALVDGGSLADLTAAGPLPPERVRALGARIAEALAHVHAAGVVHRDLKPANVLIRRSDGQPLLSDFGLAGVRGAERLTLTGDVLGTPLYMAPEQILGQRGAVGPAADVWGLGAVLYQLAAGAPPFSGMDLEHQARLVTRAAPQALADPELQAIVARALRKDPAARPSASELAAALAGPLPEGWRQLDPPRARRRPRWVVALAGTSLTLAAATAGGVAVAARHRRELEGWRAEADRLTAATAPLDPGWLLEEAPGAAAQVAESAGAVAALRAAADGADLPLDAADGALLRARFARALRSEAWGEAEELLERAPAALRAVLAAHLAVSRGAPLAVAPLRRALEEADPAGREAAAVLLARALGASDPTAASEVLANRAVGRELAARERRSLRVFEAVAEQDLLGLERALRAAPPPERLSGAYRAGAEHARRALAAADARAASNALELLARLHAAGAGSSQLARAGEDLALGAAVCGRVRELAVGERRRQAAQLLDALARSGLRPEDQVLRALGEDLFVVVRARSSDLQATKEWLISFVRLDFPLPPRTLRGPDFMELTRRLGAGPEVRYIELRARALQGHPEEVGPARRRLLELVRLSEQDGTLGPRVRAQALAEAFEDTALGPADRAALAEEVRRLDPDNPWGHALSARVHAERGDRARALEGLEAGELAYGRRYGTLYREILQHRVYVHALLGDRGETDRSLEEIESTFGETDATQALRRRAEEILRERGRE